MNESSEEGARTIDNINGPIELNKIKAKQILFYTLYEFSIWSL